MTDAELAAYLCLRPGEAAIFLPQLTPEKRAVYERMAQVEIEASLWLNGLGPRPKDALIDTDRSTRRRKGWR
jgi:hypothetical protein